MAPKRQGLSPARPGTTQEALHQASAALREGRFELAERLADGVVRSAPGNVAAVRLLAHALLLQGRYADALPRLERAVRRNPNPELEALLARTLKGVGREDEALTQLQRATTRRPAFPLAFLQLGEMLGERGRFQEALSVFEAGLAATPGEPILRVGLGYLHLKRQDRAGARTLLAELLAEAPDRHDVQVALARTLALDGDQTAAIDLYERALKTRRDDPLTRVALARCLLEQGKRRKGESRLREAVRGAPELLGAAISTLSTAPHGRLFLRPSAAEAFFRDRD